jgi:E3 ubiquitin-protein ligase BRE1
MWFSQLLEEVKIIADQHLPKEAAPNGMSIPATLHSRPRPPPLDTNTTSTVTRLFQNLLTLHTRARLDVLIFVCRWPPPSRRPIVLALMRLEARTVTVPSLDLVKMEDRKRPGGLDDSAPPAKRQAVTVNGAKSHQDTDLPWKDDIEAFQKDAIFRQMREYKREKATLEQQVADMEKRSKYHDDHLRIIDMWFSQLLEEVKIIADQHLPKEAAPNGMSIPATLLFSDNETFSKHLADRTEKIKSALTGLFSKIPTASPEVAELQQRISGLLALEKDHINQLHQITSEKEELAERFDNATHRYMVAEKKMDRMKSVQVRKLEEQAIATSVKEEPASASKAAETNGVNGVSNEEAEALREASKEVIKRREQVEQLEAKNKELTEQVTALNFRLCGLTEEDFAKTELFKTLKSMQEDSTKKLNNLEATNVQLREEVQKLQSTRTAFRMQVDDEARAMLSETEAQLVQSEANLARIRANRDELLAKLSILEASQKDNHVSAARIEALNEAKEHRITALELELKRLKLIKEGPEPYVLGSDPELEALSPEEMREKIKSTNEQYQLLLAELPSMEEMWNKAKSQAQQKIQECIAWEDRVAHANADKAKADQKYFAAMKAKETRDQEVRVLRAQATKSTEIIAQLKETESLSRSLIDKYEKQQAEMRVQMEELSIQQRALQQKINEYQLAAENRTNEVAELKKTITTNTSAILASEHAQRELDVERDKLQVRVEGLTKQVDMWKKRSQGNQSEETHQMRSMLQCQICKDAFKDTALKVCGHTFCHECVQDRIINRLRKCPNCGKTFGAADTMRIHF